MEGKKSLSFSDLLSYSLQVSRGMEFLASKKVRNIRVIKHRKTSSIFLYSTIRHLSCYSSTNSALHSHKLACALHLIDRSCGVTAL